MRDANGLAWKNSFSRAQKASPIEGVLVCYTVSVRKVCDTRYEFGYPNRTYIKTYIKTSSFSYFLIFFFLLINVKRLVLSISFFLDHSVTNNKIKSTFVVSLIPIRLVIFFF